jgi:hypothetical protein
VDSPAKIYELPFGAQVGQVEKEVKEQKNAYVLQTITEAIEDNP